LSAAPPAPLPPALAARLEPGETVRWSAQPEPFVFVMRGLNCVFYGATWSVLGAFWYRGSGGVSYQTSAFEGYWRLVPLLSIPFIVAGMSFFFYPLRLGPRARRTWYVVTDRRVFIAEIFSERPPRLQIIAPAQRGATARAVQRFDKLYDVLITRRAQEQWPHLPAPLDTSFLGLADPAPALAALAALPGSHHDP